MVRKGIAKLVLTSVLLALAGFGGAVQAKESISFSATVSLNQLPPQGIETYKLIRQGGPFPYGKDGVVFGNRERLLPAAKRGYYREYTVAANDFTPARGAKRIVCGGWAPRQPDDCYYSADHYASFMRIQAQP